MVFKLALIKITRSLMHIVYTIDLLSSVMTFLYRNK